MPYVVANRSRLYYEVAGAGDPVVLIHGLGSDARVWDDQFEPLAAFYRVIRYDIRGHGRSAVPNGEPYAHADDLHALLVHLDIARAALVGQSLGGEIAVGFALAYPESVTHLVLADPSLEGYEWSDDWKLSWEPIISAFNGSGSNAPVTEILAHPVLAPAFAQPDVIARLAQIFADYSGWHFVNADPQIEADPPAIQRLAQIHVPVLVVVGEQDLRDYHRIGAILQRDLPNARRTDIAGVGHVVPMEAPAEFNALVLDFLGQP